MSRHTSSLRKSRRVAAGLAALGVLTPAAASAQAIANAPEAPDTGAASLVLEHVEAPGEIALGTMAVRFWATLRDPAATGRIEGAALLFRDGEAVRRIEMEPVDGAFDSPLEEAVGTVDTYAWVRDGAHEWEIRAASSGRTMEVVGQGAIRVKGRISTPDLVLFDDRGAAHPWIGSGVGGFAPAEALQSGLVGFAPALADVNGDRLPDILWPTEQGRVLIWRNRGGGRFEVLRTVDVGADVVAGAVGDVDGDGKPDLVTATAARTLEIRLGVGDLPDFTAQLTLVPEKLALADLDGDGRVEICVALLGLQQGEIQVWTGHSGGHWAPSYRLQPPDGGRGRILQLAGSPTSRGLIVASAGLEEGVLESWGPPADTDSVSVPVCRVRYRVPGEPVLVVAGRFADEVPWVTVVREGPGAVLYGIREGKGLRRLGFLERVPEAIGVLDLDADGDDDLVTGGRDLQLWINVRGTGFREAGESPYLLDFPVEALVAGNLDERGS